MDRFAGLIVPAYYDENTIERCLQSIRNQTYEKWEAIIVHDGSNDDSPRIIVRFGKMGSRFEVFHKSRGNRLPTLWHTECKRRLLPLRGWGRLTRA